MESFPDDLLVGVFPLVFAIDATDVNKNKSGEINNSSNRGRFDKFLDVMVASLVDDEDALLEAGSTDGDKRRSVSLFRADEDDDYSSDDQEVLFGGGDDPSIARKRRANSFSSSIYPPFGRRSVTRISTTSSQGGGSGGGGGTPHYAKSLAMGQSFFERARIESYGTTHGFPPSKDPTGDKNLVHRVPEAVKSRDVNKLKELFRNHPLDGILPAGWVEKQVHALPSTILVVCTVSANAKEQMEHDKQLFQTIEHLAASLAPKRKCQIHVIGLTDDDLTDIQAQGWSRSILEQVEATENDDDDSFRVTLLRASGDLDFLDAGLPPGPSLKQLHDLVRDASSTYYLSEARRTKEKLAKLLGGSSAPADPILPLIIRYYVKIGFFYEFQLKHEKSLRFFAEAYRHTCRYYQFLQSDRAKKRGDTTSALEKSSPSHFTDATHDSVEVELSTDNTSDQDVLWGAVVPPPPSDMLHQCRAVAEWLNLKLLSAGFSSRAESGVMAAAAQWRNHQRTFCSPSRQGSSIPDWLAWSYVARQRLVFCQLVERYPLTSCSDFDTDNDELSVLCSPWRTCLATTEAFLRLAREVDLLKDTSALCNKTENDDSDRLRHPFIGALCSEGLSPLLAEECKLNHREKALQLILKTINLYEGELRKQKRGFYAADAFRESSSSRSGARMFYLAGGILVGMNRHEEAVPHLEKATKYAKGWRELELAIRKMLIECYEKHTPSHSDPMADESSQAIASMLLDSYFNADMSSQDLRRALGQFSKISGCGSLRWYRESFSDEDPDLPFTFEVTFPENIFATIGDTVKASIWIKSNLDYAVHVNSVVLLSLAGELPISPNDLMRATNASEGSNGGIIIQRKREITIEAETVLPRDLSIIAADDSGNGGELQGVAGKGSFSKSARPRTAGLTSAGGARLLSADQLSRENKVTQGWSLRFLGGKPLKCDGLRVAFYPVQVGKVTGSSDQVPVIELTIEKKKPRTAADIKRTPFEEENYIASAWSRPQSLPLSYGPRSLRVLGPQPQMVVTNLTEPLTDGKALEGTVNRVVLKFQSGPTEHCADISFKVSCFSVLITADGTTKRLVSQEKLSSEAETSVDMKNTKYRTPVLVSASHHSNKPVYTDYGYALPVGWELAESGQGFDGKVRVLKGGESAHVPLDFFRPSPILQAGEAEVINRSLCKTDFYVTVHYRKEAKDEKRRSTARGGRGSGRGSGTMGRGRGRGGENKRIIKEIPEFAADEVKPAPDDVSLEYSGTIVWTKPIEASFSPGATISPPRGMAYPSNQVGQTAESSSTDFVAADGGMVAAKCTLYTKNTSEELRAEIAGIRFQPNEPDEKLKVELVDSLGNGGRRQLCTTSVNDACRVLSVGCKFSVAYSLNVNLPDKNNNEESLEGESSSPSEVRGPLGAVEVEWRPFSLQLPPGAFLEGAAAVDTCTLKHVDCHGPLRLEHPSTVAFQGPMCEVQKAPFWAQVFVVPPVPTVALPFEVNYTLENLTNFHQTLEVSMKEATATTTVESRILISGLTHGQLVLAPKEKLILSYTVLATRPGHVLLPPLSVASSRYRTWVLHETSGNKNLVYILP